MINYEFREARLEDLEEIYILVDGNMAGFRSKKALRDELGSPNYFNYLVCVDGEIAGICNFFLMADFVDLNLILIDEKYRGRGLGRLLLLESMEVVKRVERNSHDPDSEEDRINIFINLEVSVYNFKAAALYQSVGFEELTRRKDYYAPGEDAIFMRRLLY